MKHEIYFKILAGEPHRLSPFGERSSAVTVQVLRVF
jgi:hypothetical protein